MDSKKSYIPIKVFISYLAIAALIITVGWILYTENTVFNVTENKIAEENAKVLKVSNLLSNIYETENLARITIQSDSYHDFQNYLDQTRSLRSQIDSLKLLVKADDQLVLLDSVKFLLTKKTANIVQLKKIKRQSVDEVAVKKAITNFGKMQESLRKLRMADFIKNPSNLSEYERRVYGQYVEYMNQNIKEDSTNTLTKKTSDSLIAASKRLLNNVQSLTEKKKATLDAEERNLLKNELAISEQLRKVLNVIEREIIENTTKSNALKEISLKKTNDVVTTAAIIGLVLTLFFSILILTDFSKTQSYKTQLETAKAKTESLLQNREQLISTVSHDLKTPLSTIIGYTELLDNSQLSNKQHYYTKNIKSSSEYISKLVQDLLDFTKIEAGKIIVETVPFSLTDVIKDVSNSVQSVYQGKSIALSLDIEESLNKKIIGDPFRLRQILTNIIGNAYKFTESGFIKITARPNSIQNKVTITIEDSGIGIKPENLKLVFEEFTQADENIEKSYGGTGLGLTISKKMAEILGGKLYLESTFGKGSTFKIDLPLQFDTTGSNDKSKLSEFTNLAAIVVDDDDSLLRLTTEVLKQKGFKIHPFTNASEALKAIQDTDFDFIITDIQMPEIDGFQFLKSVKSTAGTKYKNQPIIAVTGRADLETEMYLNAGFTTVVRKPFSPTTLLEVIHSVFEKKPIIKEISSFEMRNPDTKKPYSLASLISFLPNDNEALKEVLQSFETTTQENIQILETSIVENDIAKMKEIAHRMGPMFRQISANEIGTILQEMELNVNSAENAATLLTDLKDRIERLFILFRQDSVI